MRRNFFNPRHVVSQLRNLLPSSLSRQLNILREKANRRPGMAAGILVAVATANLLLLVIVSERSRQQPLSYRSLNPIRRVVGDRQLPRAAEIPFTLHNFLEVRAMKDSLATLMGKTSRTREDTLLFIRILERYARLDTAFATQLHRKDKSPSSHPKP
jgi:hypothetical protein